MAPQLRSPENDTKLPENPPQPRIDWGPSPANLRQSPSAIPVDFSPPLIAMVVVAATAFLVVSYFRLISRHLLPPVLLALRRWRHRWRRWSHRPRDFVSDSGDIQSPPSTSMYDSTTTTFHLFSPCGLDEDVIKTIPLSVYSIKGTTSKGSNGRIHDCAVCLLEFEENDYVRTLPVCAHAFHVDCIDIWLKSHANCPLCRAGIFRPESPFIPLMASRIRPSFDDGILDSFVLESRSVAATISDTPATEIVPIVGEGSMRRHASEDHRLNYHHHHSHRDFVLKRSYSFGFERSSGTDRMVLEAATATPWRYHRRGSFWSKRPSPFTSLSKHRVFSFRSYRGMKSPFFRRRPTTFFPMSESNVRFSSGGSSRRSKSLASPMFMRSSGIMAFSSSRMRCGDLEALLSPERLNGR